ncbi:pre-rRNA 2'-O-ribose RNA methyltransferase FTSJ3 [Sinocyclocheilus grahami]|uniref:pre-rRNA 2'-O-ribose RNA methyltransferase FTSJ3 n=1 Tax=Sinocyclocheilus grahami TaxID=75366 RepID=UPI0007AD1C3A|nr:PREDICTED: pre-rRNA processing protein FTSJ3 [Sinocyclocheilus grahami]
MGKKLKVGKTRKDKFYHLAKETGYRSRSSFKLIQLNRKFQFLQRARALVDLCAAPGGWLQVASKFMPVSSLIIGVDLVPIRPIPNVVMLQEDITTEKCRQALRKELQTWKVDVVLNDGAPNVGANWSHDAFSQANLTLMALKLACEFLTKGGTFITKVFRSKDYQPLMWIFQQFFKKVQATKPQASRNESAEIFVVCQSFLAPDKIDSKFFDPKHAFKEVDIQVKSVNELVSKKKPKAEGYSDGDLTLYHTFSVTEFLKAENPVDFLSKANEITFNNPELESHPITSPEIRECCCDIKVLGRKELRLLLSWRSKLRRFLAKKLKQDAKQLDQEMSSNDDDSDIDEKESKRKGGEQKDEENAADGEEEEMEKKLAEMKAEEFAELKRSIQHYKASAAVGASGATDDDNFQVVAVEKINKRVRILNAEGLALGAQIATSKKRARDLVDGSFHRFANSEDMTEVPAWLFDDEKKHRKRPVPITKEMVEEYKQKWREINARPVRRVAEAKARKKRRMLKKMEQAKKKAEAVVDTVDISEREKMAQLKSIYKKAGVGKEKRDITYIVAKKGVGRRVHRPAGLKGNFRVVDGRLKKDTRAAQRKEQRGRGKGGRGHKGGRDHKGGRGMKTGKGHANKK